MNDEAGRGRTQYSVLRGLLTGLGFLASGVLIWLMVRAMGEAGEGFWGTLIRIPPWAWAALVLLTVGQVSISAFKWCHVARIVFPKDGATPAFSAVAFYTAAGGVLSNFVTVYGGLLLSRTVAMRVFNKYKMSQSAVVTVLEQGFDVLIIACFATAGLIVLLFDLNWLWLCLLPVLIASACGGVMVRSGRLLAWLLHRRITHRLVSEDFSAPEALNRLLRPTDVAVLLGASFLRFLLIYVRVAIVLMAIGQTIPLGTVSLAFPLVQASQLLSLTPGNIGIAEWSWVGLIAFQGGPIEAAAAFALILRIAGFGAVVAATILFATPITLSSFAASQWRNR